MVISLTINNDITQQVMNTHRFDEVACCGRFWRVAGRSVDILRRLPEHVPLMVECLPRICLRLVVVGFVFVIVDLIPMDH